MMNDKSEKVTRYQIPVTRESSRVFRFFFWLLVTGFWFLLAANAFASVSRVEFYRDGTKIGEDTSAPYTFNADTTGVPNGSHTFSAKAYDTAGNVTTSSINTVNVSNSVVDPGPWVKGFGGSGSDVGSAVVTDASDNIFVAGSFSGTANFEGAPLTSLGGRDIFLAKLNSSGNPQWVHRFGDSGDEFVAAITLDSSGNIFLGGYFGGTGNFGGVSTGSAGGWDFFIAKYSPEGEFRWSRKVGGTSDDVITSIALDLARNNVLVTGHFQGTVNFTTATLASADTGTDTFLAKYSAADGSPIWAKSFSNRGYDTGMGVFVDNSDNILLAGYFGGRIDLGSGILYLAGTSGLNDIYIAKFPPSGTTAPSISIWSKRYGGTDGESLYAAGLDRSGNLVLGGVFSKKTDLGGGELLGTGMFTDMFLAKYFGFDGSYVWGRVLLCNQGGGPRSIQFDNLNNLLVSGYFYGTTHFGNQTLTSAGSWDVFAAKYSSTGAPLWAEKFGGTSGDDSYGIAVDSGNNPIVTGSFSGSADYGGTYLTSAGLGDIFVVKRNGERLS